MKDSKFWIWFIPLFLIVSIGIYFALSKSVQKNSIELKSDAIKIKEEYLKYNDDYYNVNLSNSNVYKYIDINNLKEVLNNKDGLIFIGDSKNNISRKNLVVLNDVVSSTSVPEVYYINITDEIINIIKEKKNSNIYSGTLVAVQGGNILNVYYPNFILDNRELNENDREKLFNEYKEIVNKFIEECDENC